MLNPNKTLKKTFRLLYWDIFWFGILAGTTISFLAVYAARLGASSLQIGLLSAGPAVVNLLFTLPSGRWLQGRSLYRVSFISSVWQRLGYVVLVALPWLVSAEAQIWGIAWIILVMSIPGTLLAISFNSMFADVVPSEYRGEIVGKRNALYAVSVTVSALVSGQILDLVAFPVNYQIVFLVGAVGALMSSYYLGRLQVGKVGTPETAAPFIVEHKAGRRHLGGWVIHELRSLIRLDLLAGSFGKFLLAYFCFYLFQYMPLPLFTLWMVNELQLGDSAISLGTALFYIMMMLGSLRLDRISRRWGHRKVFIFSALLLAHYPLLLGLAQDAVLYWVVSITGGLLFAMLNGSLVNRLMERVPEQDRPAHMMLHNLALNSGILLGSLLGPALGDNFGLRDALFISAALRLVAGFLIWRWG